MTQTLDVVLAALAAVGQAAVVAVVLLALASRASAEARRALATVRADAARLAAPLGCLVAALATAGSLYYSEAAGYIPCTLCWYQRIAMYPLLVVLGVAALRRDRAGMVAALPLSVAGMGLAAYHVYVERFEVEGSPFCRAGAPCTVRWVFELGYVTIPVLALTAFALVAVLVALAGPAAPDGGRPES